MTGALVRCRIGRMTQRYSLALESQNCTLLYIQWLCTHLPPWSQCAALYTFYGRVSNHITVFNYSYGHHSVMGVAGGIRTYKLSYGFRGSLVMKLLNLTLVHCMIYSAPTCCNIILPCADCTINTLYDGMPPYIWSLKQSVTRVVGDCRSTASHSGK